VGTSLAHLTVVPGANQQLKSSENSETQGEGTLASETLF